jgi:phosphate butyryltransferase
MMITRSEDLIAHVQQAGRRYRLVVVAADDADTIETVSEAWKHGVVQPTLVGPADRIAAIARELSVDISGFEVVDREDRQECIVDSVRRVRDGEGDFIMKGAVRTGDLMKELLHKTNNLRTDRIVSHVGAFTAPGENRIMLITDAGINIAPDLARKKDITLNAVDVAHALGIERPRVAVLSFIEKIENKKLHPAIQASTEDAERLTEMNRAGDLPGCIVEGPYALDNAISPYAAKKKKIVGEVAGRADILIAHDINMGNAIYKSLQIWVGAVVAGVVVGSKAPVVVPSRADSTASKLQSIGLAMLLMMRAGR